MDRTRLPLLVAALLVLGAPSVAPAAPGLDLAGPVAPPSWVAGPAGAPTEGEFVVGVLVPSPPSARLVDLVPWTAVASFAAAEDARSGGTAAALGEDPTETILQPGARVGREGVVPEEEAFEAWGADAAPHDGERARRHALAALAQAVLEARRVRLHVRHLLAADCAGVPIVLVDGAVEHAGDASALSRAVAAGARVLCTEAPLHGVGERVADLFPATTTPGTDLVAACLEAIDASPLVHRFPEDPTGILSVRREGEEVVLRLRGTPLAATLRDLGDRVVARASIGEDATVRVAAPDPDLDPRTHRVVWEVPAGAIRLRRAERVVDLVGTPVRRVLAPAVAQVGAPFAPRVLFRNSLTGAPVAGREERLGLRRGEAILAQATGRTDAAGSLVAALVVPADAAPGPADLVVGEDRFPVALADDLRLSVVTDRALYRPTDDVHVRVMAHRGATGRPAAGVEVALRLATSERRVTTSAHGIAGADLPLVDREPGRLEVVARAAQATASAPIVVRAFDPPTFTVTAEPACLSARPGETAPLVVTVRYLHGPPVPRARVDASGPRGIESVPDGGATDAEGRCVLAVRLASHARSGALHVYVQDVDGRSVVAVVPVEAVREADAPTLSLEPLEDPVVGRPCRFALAAPGSRLARIDVPDGPSIDVPLDASGRGVATWTPQASDTTVSARAGDLVPVARRIQAAPIPADRPVARVDRRLRRVGETLDVDVLGPDGPAYVDLSRDDTVLVGTSVTVAGGSGRASIPLTPELAGVLALRVWRWDGETPRGSRVALLVVRGRSLRVEARVPADVHRPGETAVVDVTLTDREGRPTAGVLGYWGVDEALLALEPWREGHEEVFDVLAPERLAAWGPLARRVELGEDPAFPHALAALGPPEAFDDVPAPWTIRDREERGAERRVGEAVQERVEQDLARLRAAFLEAFQGMPLEDLRTASSLQEVLRRLVESRRLAPVALRDPWGTPYAWGDALAWHEERLPRPIAGEAEAPRASTLLWWYAFGTACASAGPDLRWGTADDRVAVWTSHEIGDVPGRLGRFLRFLRALRPRFDSGPDEPAFWGPATTGHRRGGAVGGAFAGRGSHCNLRAGAGGKSAETSAPVRRDFAPTLCFVPEAIVGPEGTARLEIPLKDAITTWRLRLVASSDAGAVGTATARLRVSQPLHLAPWIPSHLTVGDDLELPVAVRNETDAPAEVVLGLACSGEIEPMDAAQARVTVDPHGTSVHAFRVRAARPGVARVRVDAASAAAADAVERIVEVRPFAREVVEVWHGSLEARRPWSLDLPAPPSGREGARRATVYPSPLADVVGGLEGLVREPHGCFEQTSATVYPMVLALDYLRRTGQAAPDLEARARRHLVSGVERLLSYEVPGEPGGFDWWGKGPANLFLTAYGLLEFRDLAAAGWARAGVVERIASWLLARQGKDGAWRVAQAGGPVHDAGGATRGDFEITAYVAGALARAGKPSPAARDWLVAHAAAVDDPYALALGAWALLSEDASSGAGRGLVDRLLAARSHDEQGVFWATGGPTAVGARGRTASIETTALAVQALLLDGRRSEVVAAGLDRIAAWRDASGTFGSTQSTIQALQALLAADPGPQGQGDFEVALAWGEGPATAVRVPTGATSPIEVGLEGVGGPSLRVSSTGTRAARVAFARTTWASWGEPLPPGGRLAFDVAWPQDVLPVGRPATAVATVRNRSSKAAARVVTLVLGIPPGCDLEPTDVRGPGLERVERAETAVHVYLRDLPPGAEREVRLTFRPRHGIDVRTAPSRAYEYYVPEEATVVAPRRVRAARASADGEAAR